MRLTTKKARFDVESATARRRQGKERKGKGNMPLNTCSTTPSSPNSRTCPASTCRDHAELACVPQSRSACRIEEDATATHTCLCQRVSSRVPDGAGMTVKGQDEGAGKTTNQDTRWAVRPPALASYLSHCAYLPTRTACRLEPPRGEVMVVRWWPLACYWNFKKPSILSTMTGGQRRTVRSHCRSLYLEQPTVIRSHANSHTSSASACWPRSQ